MLQKEIAMTSLSNWFLSMLHKIEEIYKAIGKTSFYNDEPYGSQFTIFMLSRECKIIVTAFLFLQNEVTTSIMFTN